MTMSEIIRVYCENHTKHINILQTQNAEYLQVRTVVYIVNNELNPLKTKRVSFI
jgi:hypothetical protein